MDDKTLNALKGSIAKWEGIVAGTGTEEGASNCPLCLIFNNGEQEETDLCCDGCPVFNRTGARYCTGSPWDEWNNWCVSDKKRFANTPKKKQLAQAELDFLRSLLPVDATPLTSAVSHSED